MTAPTTTVLLGDGYARAVLLRDVHDVHDSVIARGGVVVPVGAATEAGDQ